jgi:hypothetical protein
VRPRINFHDLGRTSLAKRKTHLSGSRGSGGGLGSFLLVGRLLLAGRLLGRLGLGLRLRRGGLLGLLLLLGLLSVGLASLLYI